MYFFPGSTVKVPILWYFCPEDSVPLPWYTKFASGNWASNRLVWPGIGEVLASKRPWRNGSIPPLAQFPPCCGGTLNDLICGSEGEYRNGILASACAGVEVVVQAKANIVVSHPETTCAAISRPAADPPLPSTAIVSSVQPCFDRIIWYIDDSGPWGWLYVGHNFASDGRIVAYTTKQWIVPDPNYYFYALIDNQGLGLAEQANRMLFHLCGCGSSGFFMRGSVLVTAEADITSNLAHEMEGAVVVSAEAEIIENTTTITHVGSYGGSATDTDELVILDVDSQVGDIIIVTLEIFKLLGGINSTVSIDRSSDVGTYHGEQLHTSSELRIEQWSIVVTSAGMANVVITAGQVSGRLLATATVVRGLANNTFVSAQSAEGTATDPVTADITCGVGDYAAGGVGIYSPFLGSVALGGWTTLGYSNAFIVDLIYSVGFGEGYVIPSSSGSYNGNMGATSGQDWVSFIGRYT